MAGLFSMFGGGNRAQGPGSGSQPRQGGGFGALLDPSVALPMAAALMGNQGNMQNFAGALGAAGPALQQHQDARKQLAQRNATLEFLRQQSPEMAQAVESGMPVGEAWKTYLKQREAQGPTDTMRNLQWRAEQAGLKPGTQDYAKFMSSGGKEGMTINVGDGAPGLGKLSSDYGYVLDPQTRQPRIDPQTGLPQAAPIPGSPAARDIASAEDKDAMRAGQAAVSTRVVTTAAQRARNAAKERDFGPYGQGVAKFIPWTDSAEVARQVEVLASNAKVENLNAMRQSSPTGGALGSVTEKESAMLKDKAGALDPSSPTFERDLNDYELTLLQIVHGPNEGQRIFNATRQGDTTAPQPQEDDEVNALIERYGSL